MIRGMTAADADTVFTFACGLSRSGPLDRERFASRLASALADDRCVLLVAEDGNEPVGYLMGLLAPMFVYDGLAFVQELFVVEDRRGQGHGRDLMSAFHAMAAERGAGVAALATRRAGPFNEALGYATSAAYYRRDLH